MQTQCDACAAEDEAGDATAGSPVQAERDACAAEDEAAGNAPIQMWDCGEYDKPICRVQTKEDESGAAEDENEGEDRGEEDEEPGAAVQAKCARCGTDLDAVQTRGRPDRRGSRRDRSDRRGCARRDRRRRWAARGGRAA